MAGVAAGEQRLRQRQREWEQGEGSVNVIAVCGQWATSCLSFVVAVRVCVKCVYTTACNMAYAQ